MRISGVFIPNCCIVPCVIDRGTNVSMRVDFTVDKTYSTMTLRECTEFGADECVGPELSWDFCRFTTCPIEKKKQYSAKVILPVDKTSPPVSA